MTSNWYGPYSRELPQPKPLSNSEWEFGTWVTTTDERFENYLQLSETMRDFIKTLKREVYLDTTWDHAAWNIIMGMFRLAQTLRDGNFV